MDKLNANLSGEAFLDAIEAACEARDREAMARLSQLALSRKNLKWQAAARHADNFIVALQRDNAELQETCQAAFLRLVPDIRKE